MIDNYGAMRNAWIAAAIAVGLASPATAQSASSVSTYHGALDRAGHYVVPGLTSTGARLAPRRFVPRQF